MTSTSTVVQVIESDRPTSDGYDGTEGYVVERCGEFVSQHATLAEAVAAVGGSVSLDDGRDYYGRRTWTVAK